MPELLYQYEKKRVSCCPVCNQIQSVGRELQQPEKPVDHHDGRCISCGRIQVDDTDGRFSCAPYGQSDVYQSESRTRERAIFQRASSFPHFSLDFPALDSLLRPLSSGRVVVLAGAHTSAVAELASFRAQLPYEVGGLNSGVLFIDGGNRSDPYLFSSFAKQWGLRPDIAMRRVTSCRVFTMYQLADLVCNLLAHASDDYATRLVVISDLLGTFNEPELDEREARRLLRAVKEGIEKVKESALVLLTLGAPNKHDETVQSWADTALTLTEESGRVHAELTKHPRKASCVSNFKLNSLLIRPKPRGIR